MQFLKCFEIIGHCYAQYFGLCLFCYVNYVCCLFCLFNIYLSLQGNYFDENGKAYPGKELFLRLEYRFDCLISFIVLNLFDYLLIGKAVYRLGNFWTVLSFYFYQFTDLYVLIHYFKLFVAFKITCITLLNYYPWKKAITTNHLRYILWYYIDAYYFFIW